MLKGLGVERIGPYLDMMRVANRNLGRLYTSLHLPFAIKNFVRDLGTSAPSMIDFFRWARSPATDGSPYFRARMLAIVGVA